MSKRTLTAVEQMVVDTRNEVLVVLRPCKNKAEGLHFLGKVAPIAKAIGVTDPTLKAFAEGASVSNRTLSLIRAYLDSRQDEAESPTEA